MADAAKINSKAGFQAFLDKIRGSQNMPADGAYRPIEGLPVIRVVEKDKRDEFYALWRKGNDFSLVPFDALRDLPKDAESKSAVQQAGPRLMQAGMGGVQPAVTINRADLAEFSGTVEVKQSEIMRRQMEILERQRKMIEEAERQRVNPPSPSSETQQIQPPAAKLSQTFEGSSGPASVIVPFGMVQTVAQTPKSLSEMGVLANPVAKIEDNHRAAVKASEAIRDKALTKDQVSDVINSFRTNPSLKGYFEALQKQNKASDPTEGWRVAAEEIHRARQDANNVERTSRRAQRAVTPEEAAARVQQGAADPTLFDKARERVAPVIAGATTQQEKTINEAVTSFVQRPDIQNALMERAKKVAAEMNVNIQALPKNQQDFIFRKMSDEIGAQRGDIYKDLQQNRENGARTTLMSAAEKGLREGIEKRETAPATVPRSQSGFTKEQEQAVKSGDIGAVVRDAVGKGLAAAPTEAQARADAERRAEQRGRDQIRDLQSQQGDAQQRAREAIAAAQAQGNPKTVVAQLMSGKEFTEALESRYAHIKSMTGVNPKDPKEFPPAELDAIKRNMMQEAMRNANDIAKTAQSKGPDAGRQEIASIGERMIIQRIDEIKSAPKPRAEVTPADQPVQVAVSTTDSGGIKPTTMKI